MAQLFHRSANSISKISIVSAVIAAGGLIAFAYTMDRGHYMTDVKVVKEQPVPFSHKHHVSDDGIDCRYCHTSVEQSSFAGLPPTKTCMNCHSQMWAVAPVLEPLRESLRTGRSIAWTRVHDLPDFVYFNHSIHVHNGIGCSTCHGRVDKMPITWQAEPLRMQWCLDCHRNPARYVRPRDQVFNMAYQPPRNQDVVGAELVKEYHIQSLTSCSTCHR